MRNAQYFWFWWGSKEYICDCMPPTSYMISILWERNILKSHYIMTTLLIPHRIIFSFQKCQHLAWHWLHKMLISSLRYLVPKVVLQFPHIARGGVVARIWFSRWDHKGSNGLMSQEFGGEDMTWKSLEYSSKHSTTIRPLWHGALTCWLTLSPVGNIAVMSGWTLSVTTFKQSTDVRDCSVGIMGYYVLH